MKRKGFTLIELLAVIVVLAIIALIATPIILNVIEKAKIGSAENSVYGYIDAVEKQVVINQTSGINYFDLSGEKEYAISELSELGVKIKGKVDNATVVLNTKGVAISGKFCINNYSVDYDGHTAKYNKNANYCNEEVSTSLVGTVTKTLIDNSETYEYMGGTYLKGNPTNNYIWYNGFMWRIMGKNSDGTIRLITVENVATLLYGTTIPGDWNEEGYIKDWLNIYFLNNLKPELTDIIQEGNYFCNEIAEQPMVERTTCLDTSKIKTRIGLIALDEHNLAGGGRTSYLNTTQYQWTMTLHDAFPAWFIDSNGGGNVNSESSVYPYGVRPVINVSSTATITDGSGTATDMYILEENKSSITGTIGDNATSGEYVVFSENKDRIYRVVDRDDEGIKLISEEYYSGDSVGVIKFGDNNTFTSESGIGLRLNSDALEWLGLNNSNKLVKNATWYQGESIEREFKHADSLKETNKVNSTVGLIRVGEMLSAHSVTMLTDNYAEPVTYKWLKAKDYWTMNKGTNGGAAYISQTNEMGVTNTMGYMQVRPVIKVRSDLDITGGNGTWNNPYQI